jgi:uncharacterized SAM-binding protein YcdF (DUF218 family)
MDMTNNEICLLRISLCITIVFLLISSIYLWRLWNEPILGIIGILVCLISSFVLLRDIPEEGSEKEAQA